MPTKELTDKSGRHRLTMLDVAEGRGANFHSLNWAINDGSAWADHVVIGQEDFRPPTNHRRWVSDLYSFDPGAGRAIIQVAEGDAPEGTVRVHYIYSWRNWDLQHNREVEMLSVCKSPFDKYEP